ncbi:sensor histidine kinase [Companilactobacillus furfuricola]|uniref:sensor histidine kinase n=1 Tax=Companilactobacillus furfuricola TaxID=1462575 RepID=UPI000F7ACE73|nr:HAMP domain-containing sensor histidine kinase [Companilactobacillus furfuricola]
MKPTKSKTYQSLINHAINRLVLIITVSISILILLVVGTQQSSNTIHEARGLMVSLNMANIDDIPSFIHWNSQTNRHSRQTSIIRVKTDKASVTATSNRRGRTILTSSASKNFLNQKKITLSPKKHVVYVKGYGFFLYNSEKNNDTTYQLWVSLNSLIQNILLLLIIIAFITFIIILFGRWWANLLAKKLSQPTISLVEETRNTIKDAQTTQPKLVVPDSPQEITELGNAFDDLLDNQNKRLQREQDFVSNASHELRTPIAAIRGNIKLIKRHGDDHPEVIPESLKFIDEESQRMQNLIENLLQLSRADRAQLLLKPLDLSQLVSETIDQYKITATHPLQQNIADGLTVSGEKDTIRQILIALLDNAQKYSAKSEPITVDLFAHDQQVILEVKDLGSGVPDDQKQQIFQRFYRMDTSHSSEIQGNGLGLSIVAKLVELNNAQITVLDNQPRGSVFRVEF